MINIERSIYIDHSKIHMRGLKLTSDNYEQLEEAEKLVLRVLIKNFPVVVSGFSGGWKSEDLGEDVVMIPNHNGGFKNC